MHLELDSKTSLIIALEAKRKRLGFTTCKSAIIKAVKLFMELPEPVYLNPNDSHSKEIRTSDKDVDSGDYKDLLKSYYFTFGYGQPHENCYHIIQAATENDARDIMLERFGNKWSMCYKTAIEAGVEQYNLQEIK